MKLIGYNPGKKRGFTIVELLTVMSIIILLIGLLVPALNRVRRYATRVKQKAQFHAMSVALEQFNAEYNSYPDSDAFDGTYPTTLIPYCGAMKLCEAMVGKDLKGFNPKSVFRRDGLDAPGLNNLYPQDPGIGTPTYPDYVENIKSRKMYLQLENANAYQLSSIYAGSDITDRGFDPCSFVLCDVYNRVTDKSTGKKIGMPILYYRADTTKTGHPLLSDPYTTIVANLGKYIYDVRGNQSLIEMGIPWDPAHVHPLATGGITSSGSVITNYPKLFHDLIRDPKVPTGDRPYRTDSYILLSAGFDGLYGTVDDVFNFPVLNE